MQPCNIFSASENFYVIRYQLSQRAPEVIISNHKVATGMPLFSRFICRLSEYHWRSLNYPSRLNNLLSLRPGNQTLQGFKRSVNVPTRLLAPEFWISQTDRRTKPMRSTRITPHHGYAVCDPKLIEKLVAKLILFRNDLSGIFIEVLYYIMLLVGAAEATRCKNLDYHKPRGLRMSIQVRSMLLK